MKPLNMRGTTTRTGDIAKYDERVAMLDGVAAQLGLGSAHGVGHAWEIRWGEKLEDLWPAIEEVAEMLIHGEKVNH